MVIGACSELPCSRSFLPFCAVNAHRYDLSNSLRPHPGPDGCRIYRSRRRLKPACRLAESLALNLFCALAVPLSLHLVTSSSVLFATPLLTAPCTVLAGSVLWPTRTRFSSRMTLPASELSRNAFAAKAEGGGKGAREQGSEGARKRGSKGEGRSEGEGRRVRRAARAHARRVSGAGVRGGAVRWVAGHVRGAAPGLGLRPR
jgi:hypothetical protein